MTDPAVILRLFVAGHGPNSLQAIANLRAFCSELFPNAHSIEIVDVFAAPERAMADGVLMTPTLLRVFPEPMVRIIGNLSERIPLLAALGPGS